MTYLTPVSSGELVDVSTLQTPQFSPHDSSKEARNYFLTLAMHHNASLSGAVSVEETKISIKQKRLRIESPTNTLLPHRINNISEIIFEHANALKSLIQNLSFERSYLHAFFLSNRVFGAPPPLIPEDISHGFFLHMRDLDFPFGPNLSSKSDEWVESACLLSLLNEELQAHQCALKTTKLTNPNEAKVIAAKIVKMASARFEPFQAVRARSETTSLFADETSHSTTDYTEYLFTKISAYLIEITQIANLSEEKLSPLFLHPIHEKIKRVFFSLLKLKEDIKRFGKEPNQDKIIEIKTQSQELTHEVTNYMVELSEEIDELESTTVALNAHRETAVQKAADLAYMEKHGVTIAELESWEVV